MRETTQVKIKIRKILDVRDVIAFVKLLVALRFRAFRLCFTAIILASIDVLSIVLLAAFVSSILLTGPQQGILGEVIARTGYSELTFQYQSGVCLLLFLTRFLLGLVLVNFILLQSNQLQLRLRNILFRLSLQRGTQTTVGAELGSGASADLIVRQVNLIGKGIVEPALRVLGELFIVLMIVVTIFIVSPLMLSFMVAFISPLVLFYILKFKRMTRVYGEVANSALEGLSVYSASFASGWRQLGVPTLRHCAGQMLDEAARNFARSDRLASLIGAAPRYFLELFMAMFLVLAVLFTKTSSVVGVGDLVLIGGACARLLPIITSISNALISFQFNRAVIGNVASQICTADMAENVRFSSLPSSPNPFSDATKIRCLKLRSVGYGYDKGVALFENVSVSLSKGDFLLINGKSGVGKTTLMDIICDLRRPTAGNIIVNGASIEKHGWLADRVFYSPQQPLIIPGSVLKNVTFSQEMPKDAERSRALSCITKVGLLRVIQRLSDGLDSDVGLDGDVLSGGQKQRLALARALYHGAEVFALDEAISGLEADSKLSILRLIKGLSEEGHIVILISHDVVAEEYATKVLKL